MKFVPTFFALFFAVAATAQPCSAPQAQIDLAGNALRARILNAADFGWDITNPSYHPDYVAGAVNPSTIFLGTVWYGGLDPAGNLKLAAGRYRNPLSSSSPFYTGPLNPATGTTSGGVCANWDRFFRVTAAEINAFLNDLGDGTLSGPHNAVRGWPGRGNPFFTGIHGFDLPDQNLAPFFDADGNGVYDPLKGDYPVVHLQGLDPFVPDEQIWTVVNDQGGGATNPSATMQTEIHITYFAFNCPEKPLLDHAMFTSHKIINRSTETINPFLTGLYVDFDLGCHTDDYLGSHPATNTFYAYNRTNTDLFHGLCDGVPSYGNNPPVQAVTFLNRQLDRFMPIYNASEGTPHPATTDPGTIQEYYHYMNGSWRDGVPLTAGGSGYDSTLSNPETTHAFPGNPNIPGEWSMLGANQPGGDQRGLGVHNFGPFAPGQIVELTTAWSYHRGPGLTHLQNVALMLDEVPHLRVLYANNFADVCTSPVSTDEQALPLGLTIWPNPATDEIHLRLADSGSGSIQVFDAPGRLVEIHTFTNTDVMRLDTESWFAGAYMLHVRTERGMAIRKVVVR